MRSNNYRGIDATAPPYAVAVDGPQVPRNALLRLVCEGMSDPVELRVRASRLFSPALNARQLGIGAYAFALAKLARYVFAQAEALERRTANRQKVQKR